jgi:hypothetical protein
MLPPVMRWATDRCFLDPDPELVGLICIMLRLLADSPSEYQRLAALSVYLARPALSAIAVVLLEWGDPEVVGPFENDIIANVSGLLASADLAEIPSALLRFGTAAQRNAIVTQLAPRYTDLVQQAWTWKLVVTIMTVATMRQRIALMQVIVRVVNARVLHQFADEMVARALDGVDAKSRVDFLGDLRDVLGNRAQFPQVNEYVHKLPVVLSAHDN